MDAQILPRSEQIRTLLNLSDGKHSLLDIARRAGLEFRAAATSSSSTATSATGGRMRCTKAHHSIGQPCGADKLAPQEHERYAKHGACDDVAWPTISEIEKWQTDHQQCPNGRRCAQSA